MNRIIIFLITLFACCITLEIGKIEPEEYLNTNLEDISSYNLQRVDEGLKLVEYDQDLMNLAQQEAERLGKLKRLESPKFKIDQTYAGFSYKVTGKIGNNYIGNKMCHNNLFKEVDKTVYDLRNICKNDRVQWKLHTKVGFGIAYDKNKNAYSVRLYYTDQSKEDDDPIDIDYKNDDEDNNNDGDKTDEFFTEKPALSIKEIIENLRSNKYDD